MKLRDFDRQLREILAIDELAHIDNSLNGVQVGRLDAEVRRIAFAVDACSESFRRAVEWNADLLFVHHGLFWGGSIAVTGSHFDRLKVLLDGGCALYAAHLPLDMHPELGNNASMAKKLGLVDLQPFGEYHGVKIGVKGSLDGAKTIDEVLVGLDFDRESCNAILPFGKLEIRTVGIVSGGATRETEQAIDENLDLYVTGDASHTVYHVCLEEGINLICGGHYQTEIWGVKALRDALGQDLKMETCFIDIPTGL